MKRKDDEDWVKKCMEIRIEGMKSVERPVHIWLRNVEEDMTDLEIDREDIYDQEELEKECYE